MKLSPVFLLVLGILAVLFIPIYLSLKNEAATHHESATRAAEGFGGYRTLEEEAEARRVENWRSLGWSEERIQQERLIEAVKASAKR
jgi:hypothetical protein